MKCHRCKIYLNYKTKVENNYYCKYCGKIVKAELARLKTVVISDCNQCKNHIIYEKITFDNFKITSKCKIYNYPYYRQKYKNNDCNNFDRGF